MFKNLSKIIWILIPVLLLNFLVFTLAWSPPTEPAPGGNAPGPLNVGDTTQYKEGSLVLGSMLQVTSGLGFFEETKPVCNEENRGLLWFEDDEEEILFLCSWNGTEYEWEVLVE